MPGHNNKGRSNFGDPNRHFTTMTRGLMQTKAWRSLPSVAQALYPWLKLEWKGANYNNNGHIKLSVRQAADRLGVSINTAAKSFHELQKKGFIVVTAPASLGLTGNAKSPSYEITEIALPTNNENHGRRLYLKWKPGKDFPVIKATVHNPRGRNGKSCRK